MASAKAIFCTDPDFILWSSLIVELPKEYTKTPTVSRLVLQKLPELHVTMHEEGLGNLLKSLHFGH